jgi:hypothetical protein
MEGFASFSKISRLFTLLVLDSYFLCYFSGLLSLFEAFMELVSENLMRPSLPFS